MLKHLNIINFALINNINIEFNNGLNILTGETGAGKSIIIDAIGILIGKRASSEFIRVGTEKAVVEGLFQIEDDLVQKIADYGISISDNEVVLTREIPITGKNICRINSRIVTLAIYQEIGKNLVDILGQNQEFSLLSSSKQLELLDEFGGNRILELKNQLHNSYNRMKKTKEKIRQLTGNNPEDSFNKIDFLEFQLEEIRDVNLQVNEDEELNREKNILINSEKIFNNAAEAYTLLNGNEGIYDKISQTLKKLETISLYDNNISQMYDELESISYSVQDINYRLKDYMDSIDYDVNRIDLIEDRLITINKIKRKYGTSIEEIFDYVLSLEKKIEEMRSSEYILEELQGKLEEEQTLYLKEANQLSLIRKETALEIEQQIIKILEDLYMPNCKFKIEFKEKNDFNSNGIDIIDFYFSPNLGEPLKPLAKIVSGGEMSRIMLGFKSVLANLEEGTTLIFDEVDTGVGGKAITSIGLKLASLSKDKQVLCITHSPQVAAFADHHYYIYKKAIEDKTNTSIKILNSDERVKELCRMLGDMNNSIEVKEHATAMLQFASNKKCV